MMILKVKRIKNSASGVSILIFTGLDLLFKFIAKKQGYSIKWYVSILIFTGLDLLYELVEIELYDVDCFRFQSLFLLD